ncbi:MAG: nucleoside deaminase [Candidatus Kapabacteria bacterium]|jgi:tRNA(adenine34) deaminase|nr:nucleoside deaminase [Candidatus Kapabacteria bacterium]
MKFTVDNQRHEYFMNIAIKEAHKSLNYDDVPIGAVIVRNDELIARGHNCVERYSNSLNHAEISAINSAVKKISYKHLYDCDLYVTLEPCSMCAGAIVLARIKRVFIGTEDPKSGAGGSIFNILNNDNLNHRCEIFRGILREECSSLIKNFFKDLRKR